MPSFAGIRKHGAYTILHLENNALLAETIVFGGILGTLIAQTGKTITDNLHANKIPKVQCGTFGILFRRMPFVFVENLLLIIFHLLVIKIFLFSKRCSAGEELFGVSRERSLQCRIPCFSGEKFRVGCNRRF